MNRDVLLDAIGMVDDRLLAEERPAAKGYRRTMTVLLAAVIALTAMTATAMAVSEDFRERVFTFFRVSQTEVIPESTVSTGLTAEDMFVEPVIAIGDVLQGKYIHTPVATLARDGVFLVCTDDVHTKQGLIELIDSYR